MVYICESTYTDETYTQSFEKYPFPLSIFQKWSIHAILEGHHILITAHTGSGKTLPAEFAIEHFTEKGKRVIYCSPIKSLSNQKFHEFSEKYPHISFGIITGDIKCNPDAQVLIVTTEILMNQLYNEKSLVSHPIPIASSLLSFQMDLNTELGCVVFDEVHYINDPDRGKVWEQCFMMLPEHIQLVMLSATIHAPERFAGWIENRFEKEKEEKEEKEEKDKEKKEKKKVYLASTNHRVVPLTHYSFITCTNSIFKIIKDKTLEAEIRAMTNKHFVIQSAQGEFNEPHYHKMRKMLDLFENKRVMIKRSHVLNQVCKYMVENEMLPALCFVLSRKQLEICAREITVPLLEDDSKVPYIIRRECEQIIRKLPNYQEYLELPEYQSTVALLEKGIAIHHAGIMPVLREMVELLFPKGYIKLLFATETFAIGVSFPIKTVVFTDPNKFDGNNMRLLHSHEYTQMSGRAGRRGIDTIGNVIHLNNLFRNVDSVSYKKMLSGMPQKLTSKFKISFQLVLSLLSIGDENITEFASKSMIQGDIESEVEGIKKQLSELSLSGSNPCFRAPIAIVEEYAQLSDAVTTAVNKKRKEMERSMTNIKEEYKAIEQDVVLLKRQREKQEQQREYEKDIEHAESYLGFTVEKVFRLLVKTGFIDWTRRKEDEENKENKENKYSLSNKGHLASHIKEAHCLVFADLVDSKIITELSSKQLVSLFSCLTNITVPEDLRSVVPQCTDKTAKNASIQMKEKYDEFLKEEEAEKIDSGTDYSLHYDLMEFAAQWCDAETAEECKYILQTMEHEKGIFLGEFIKALLKINNISSELERVAELEGNIAFLATLREIPLLTLKHVATNQSLYI